MLASSLFSSLHKPRARKQWAECTDGAKRSWRGTNETHNDRNLPPCRAGQWRAEHDPGRKPFCEMSFNFGKFFKRRSSKGSSGTRDDEKRIRSSWRLLCHARAVSRDGMTYSASDQLRSPCEECIWNDIVKCLYSILWRTVYLGWEGVSHASNMAERAAVLIQIVD